MITDKAVETLKTLIEDGTVMGRPTDVARLWYFPILRQAIMQILNVMVEGIFSRQPTPEDIARALEQIGHRQLLAHYEAARAEYYATMGTFKGKRIDPKVHREAFNNYKFHEQLLDASSALRMKRGE